MILLEHGADFWSLPAPQGGGSLLRKHHTAVPFRGEILIYGGVCKEPDKAGQFLIYRQTANRLHSYFGRTSSPSQTLPPARSGHSAAIVTIRQSLLSGHQTDETLVEGLLLVGGWSGQRIGVVDNDVWFLDVLSCTWYKPLYTSQPPGKSNFCSLTLLNNKQVAFFRGGNGVACFSELYLYDLHTGQWTQKMKGSGRWPGERNAQAMCAWKERYLILFGGWNGSEALDDLWVWDSEYETWKNITASNGGLSPGCRANSTLSIIDQNYLVLYGGNGKNQDLLRDHVVLVAELNEKVIELGLIEWYTPRWNVAGQIPNYRVGHQALLFPSLRRQLLIIGGLELVSKMDDDKNVCPCNNIKVQGADKIAIISFDTQKGFPVPIDVVQALGFKSSGRFKAFESFALSNKLSDVLFDVKGVILPAHQLVLCLNSDVFKKRFTGSLAVRQSSGNTLTIPGPSTASPAAFEIFLQSFYYTNLSACILKQRVAPWAWETDKVTCAALLNWLSCRVTSNVSETLRQPDDKSDTVRVAIADELLASSYPADAVPYPTKACDDMTELLMELFALSDEYQCRGLNHLIQIFLASLLSAENCNTLLQTAMAFRSLALTDFIEWFKRNPSASNRSVGRPKSPVSGGSPLRHDNLKAVTANGLINPLFEEDIIAIFNGLDQSGETSSRSSLDLGGIPSLQLSSRHNSFQDENLPLGTFPSAVVNDDAKAQYVHSGKSAAEMWNRQINQERGSFASLVMSSGPSSLPITSKSEARESPSSTPNMFEDAKGGPSTLQRLKEKVSSMIAPERGREFRRGNSGGALFSRRHRNSEANNFRESRSCPPTDRLDMLQPISRSSNPAIREGGKEGESGSDETASFGRSWSKHNSLTSINGYPNGQPIHYGNRNRQPGSPPPPAPSNTFRLFGRRLRQNSSPNSSTAIDLTTHGHTRIEPRNSLRNKFARVKAKLFDR